MARQFRVRKQKEPPAPVVYELSPEIAATMSRLIRLNPIQFGWVNNFKIGAVIVRGSRPKEQGGCVVLARFVKVAPLWHGLTGYDAIVRVEAWAWDRLEANQQEALVAHELCHGSMSEKGALRVMKHDLEEFGFVVRKYGAWQENIALFDRQLGMFSGDFVTSPPTEGSQDAAFAPAEAPTSLEERRARRLAESSEPAEPPKSKRRKRTDDDDRDLRPSGEPNVDALRGEAERASDDGAES